MTISYGPAPVLDGLSLMLDPLNPRSYPGTGTTWFDLSGKGNHQTIDNIANVSYSASGTFTTTGNGRFSRASVDNIPSILPPGQTQVNLTTTGSGIWIVPSNWNTLNSNVIAIGGGGGGSRPLPGVNGGGGGGGGAYSRTDNISLVPGSTVYYSIGVAGTGGTTNGSNGTVGGDTWFNASANSAPVLSQNGVLAKGGSGGLYGTSGGAAAGGSSASGVGTVVSSGGAGGLGIIVTGQGAGGGGAGGNRGNGGAGGNSTSLAGSSGGGGAGEGSTGTVGETAATPSSNSGTSGGNNAAGFGRGLVGINASPGTNGGGGSGVTTGAFSNARPGGAGGPGSIYGGLGSGGGGGGGIFGNSVPSNGGDGGNGGNYGGGGGAGAAGTRNDVASGNGGNGGQGAIIINYLGSSTQLTAMGWINLPSLGSTRPIVSSSTSVVSNDGWSFGISATGYLQLVINGSTTYTSASAQIQAGIYAHVSMVVSGMTLTFYLNGIQHDSMTVSTGMSGSSSSLTVASDSGGRYFSGTLSTILVYARSLSSMEIIGNFNAYRGRYRV